MWNRPRTFGHSFRTFLYSKKANNPGLSELLSDLKAPDSSHSLLKGGINNKMNLAKVGGRAKKGLIFVISGPSGSGKTTLAKKLLKLPQLKNKFIKSVSFTTRPKRPGERQGQSYLFVSKKEFQRLLKAKKILEYTYYLGYDYGTPSDIIEQAIKKGLHIILCLDIKGASFVKRKYPDRTVTIFIKPPSLSIAKERILGRWVKTKPAELNQRLQLASKELGYASRYDYCLVNDNLNKAVKEAKRIIKWTISQ